MKKHKSISQPRHSRIGIAIAAALGLFSGVAMAQKAPATGSSTSNQPATKVTELETVIVTANKREENIHEVAMSISVVGEAQLDNIHATQLTDFSAYVPGLQVYSNGTPGRTAVSLRGIAPLSSGATVGYYVNEVPVGSSGLYANASAFALDLLPYDISHIEILRGPQGTLYGAGAMGGLLKYVMREPDLTANEFRVGGGLSNVEGSSETGYDFRAGANIVLKPDTLGLRFSYSHNNLPGYIDNHVNGEKDINSATQDSARLSLLWQLDDVKVDLTIMQQKIDSDGMGQVALDKTTQKPLYGDLTNEVYADESFFKEINFFSATVNWNLGWGDFVSATGYSDTTTNDVYDATVQYGQVTNLLLGLPAPGSSYVNLGLDLEKFTQEFRLASKSDSPFEWMVGAFYTTEDSLFSQLVPLNELDGSPLPPPYDSIFGVLGDTKIALDYTETAVFANGSYRFNDWFKLNGGFRYASNDQDYYQVSSGPLLDNGTFLGASSEDVFTWSLSPQFQVAKDIMIYAKAATGYQSGAPNIAVAGLPASVGSSSLISYELGLKSQFADGRVSLDLTAFRIDWDDIQVITQVNGVNGLTNGGTATSQGFELASAFQATDHFTLGFNAAYTDATLTEDLKTLAIPNAAPGILYEQNTGLSGDRLPYTPEWALSATADYSFTVGANWNGHVGGGYSWVGDRVSGTTKKEVYSLQADPSTVLQTVITTPLELDSYSSLDLYASISNLSWTLRAYVKNITDERGYSSMDRVNNELTKQEVFLKGVPILPRTFGIEVDYTF